MDDYAYATERLPGIKCQMQVNGDLRDTMVLAARKGWALVEYEMPGGTTALRLIRLTNDNIVRFLFERPLKLTRRDYRNLSYYDVTRPWLRSIIKNGLTWKGLPQQKRGRSAPTPQDLLEKIEAKRAKRRSHS